MNLKNFFSKYIECLNHQRWEDLHQYVAADVCHNGRSLGLFGYRAMLVQDFQDIPDLHFDVDWLLCESTRIAARFRFDCTPTAKFLGLNVDGCRVSFAEHAFYDIKDGKIAAVLSIVDRAAIQDQLVGPSNKA